MRLTVELKHKSNAQHCHTFYVRIWQVTQADSVSVYLCYDDALEEWNQGPEKLRTQI